MNPNSLQNGLVLSSIDEHVQEKIGVALSDVVWNVFILNQIQGLPKGHEFLSYDFNVGHVPSGAKSTEKHELSNQELAILPVEFQMVHKLGRGF